MRSSLAPLLVPLLLVSRGGCLTPGSYLGESELSRLRSTFSSALSEPASVDLAGLHGAARGIKLLGEAAKGDKACKVLQEALREGAPLRDIFLASEAAGALGCKLKPSAQVTQVKTLPLRCLS